MTSPVNSHLSNFRVVDEGEFAKVNGLRYTIEASEQHPDDTNRVASVHFGSFYSLDTATKTMIALREKYDLQFAMTTSQFNVERVARVIAAERERGHITGADMLADAFETEFSNTDEGEEFRRMYDSYARCR